MKPCTGVKRKKSQYPSFTKTALWIPSMTTAMAAVASPVLDAILMHLVRAHIHKGAILRTLPCLASPCTQ